MTKKEYLLQVRYLDQRINSELEELSRVKALAGTSAAVCSGGTQNTDAPAFSRGLETIQAMEERIDREIDRLVDLKEQIRQAIDALPDEKDRLVLRLLFLNGLPQKRAAEELHLTEKTIYRRMKKALRLLVLPEGTGVEDQGEEKAAKANAGGNGHAI